MCTAKLTSHIVCILGSKILLSPNFWNIVKNIPSVKPTLNAVIYRLATNSNSPTPVVMLDRLSVRVATGRLAAKMLLGNLLPLCLLNLSTSR